MIIHGPESSSVQNEGDYSYQFHGRPFDKEEDGELAFSQFSVCHYSGILRPLRELSGI